MKKYSTQSKHLGLIAGLSLMLGLTPKSAYAAGLVDASILIPEAAEFFPMLIAFMVIFIVAKKLLWPGVLENFDKREKTVKTGLEDAAAAQKEAEEVTAAYNDKLEELDILHKQIVDEAKREAEEERARIKEHAKAEAKAYMLEAELDIKEQREQAMVDLTSAAANLSVNMTQKILEEQLDENKQVELVQRLVNNYLSEVGRTYGK